VVAKSNLSGVPVFWAAYRDLRDLPPLDRWLIAIGEDEDLCRAEHPKRRLLCDLNKGHDRGHACYPPHYKEPVFWRAA
jgi:hypothetical protein